VVKQNNKNKVNEGKIKSYWFLYKYKVDTLLNDYHFRRLEKLFWPKINWNYYNEILLKLILEEKKRE
jgi:hypothetical protein